MSPAKLGRAAASAWSRVPLATIAPAEKPRKPTLSGETPHSSMSIPFGMPSPRFSRIRYLRTNAATPLPWSQRATLRPSRSMASATNAPPGAMTTPVPVAVASSGRYAVSVGVTTLKTTAPSGVSSTFVSFCIHVSDPGAAPGQMFTVCAPARPATQRVSAIARAVSCRMSRFLSEPHDA
jgi:hypothetical protein